MVAVRLCAVVLFWGGVETRLHRGLLPVSGEQLVVVVSVAAHDARLLALQAQSLQLVLVVVRVGRDSGCSAVVRFAVLLYRYVCVEVVSGQRGFQEVFQPLLRAGWDSRGLPRVVSLAADAAGVGRPEQAPAVIVLAADDSVDFSHELPRRLLFPVFGVEGVWELGEFVAGFSIIGLYCLAACRPMWSAW